MAKEKGNEENAENAAPVIMGLDGRPAFLAQSYDAMEQLLSDVGRFSAKPEPGISDDILKALMPFVYQSNKGEPIPALTGVNNKVLPFANLLDAYPDIRSLIYTITSPFFAFKCGLDIAVETGETKAKGFFNEYLKDQSTEYANYMKFMDMIDTYRGRFGTKKIIRGAMYKLNAIKTAMAEGKINKPTIEQKASVYDGISDLVLDGNEITAYTEMEGAEA